LGLGNWRTAQAVRQFCHVPAPVAFFARRSNGDSSEPFGLSGCSRYFCRKPQEIGQLEIIFPCWITVAPPLLKAVRQTQLPQNGMVNLRRAAEFGQN
jgi:hypothetical protein